MTKKSNIQDMPAKQGNKPMKTIVSPERYAQFQEACDRLNLPNLGALTFQALEEKLQRDCPDLYKAKKND